MVRGTTAVFKFKLPHQLKHVTLADVVFWQEGYSGEIGNPLPIKMSYVNSDFTEPDSYELVVVLTGSKTKAFTDKLKARVQMKASIEEYDGKAASTIGSQPQLFTVYPMDDDIMDGTYEEDMPKSNQGYVILDGDSITKAGVI